MLTPKYSLRSAVTAPWLSVAFAISLIASLSSPLLAAKAEEVADLVQTSANANANDNGDPSEKPNLTKIREEVQQSEETENSHRERFIRHFLDSKGEKVVVTNTYTVLGSGMHYQEDGKWKNTEAAFEEFPDGFVARRGPHKAIIARRLGTQSVVDLLSSAGQRLQSAPHFLAYLERNTGQQRSLARVQSAEGRLIAPNTVLFENAFDGILADVRVVYTAAGLECDVILRQELPNPADLGLDPLNTVFQVYTEFTDTEPTAKYTALRPRRSGKDDFTGGKSDPTSSPKESDADTDELLSFGDLQMPSGMSFPVGNSEGAGLPNVRKAWTQLDGRHFLVEQIDHQELVQSLKKSLPEGARNRTRKPVLPRAGIPSFLEPAESLESRSTSWSLRCNEIALVDSLLRTVGHEIAQTGQCPANPGYVIDWSTVSSTFNQFTFATGQTYLINSTVIFSPLNSGSPMATVRFEPDVVIKYTQFASINISPRTTVDCATEMYRPAQLVPIDDNTVGETVAGSTGTVLGYYGTPAINIDGTGSGLAPATYGSPRFRWLRIKNASLGIRFLFNQNPGVFNSQFLNCDNSIQCNSTVGLSPAMDVFNCLISGGGNLFSLLSSSTINASSLTIDIGGSVNSAPSAGVTVNLGNSIVLNATTLGNVVQQPGNFLTGSTRSQVFESTTTMAYFLNPAKSGYPVRN